MVLRVHPPPTPCAPPLRTPRRPPNTPSHLAPRRNHPAARNNLGTHLWVSRHAPRHAASPHVPCGVRGVRFCHFRICTPPGPCSLNASPRTSPRSVPVGETYASAAHMIPLLLLAAAADAHQGAGRRGNAAAPDFPAGSPGRVPARARSRDLRGRVLDLLRVSLHLHLLRRGLRVRRSRKYLSRADADCDFVSVTLEFRFG
jgi:hypothetical protein